MTAMTRFSKDSRRAPLPKERKTSRTSKHLDGAKSKLEEDREIRNGKEKKQKESINRVCVARELQSFHAFYFSVKAMQRICCLQVLYLLM